MQQLSWRPLRQASKCCFWTLASFGKLFITAVAVLFCTASASGTQLTNDTIAISLGYTPSGVPVIEKAEWLATGETIFAEPQAADSLDEWIPDKFIPASIAPTTWHIKSGSTFQRGETTIALNNGLSMTWIVELTNHGSTLRLRVRLRNTSTATVGVKWFPTWNGAWQMGDGAEWVKWWRALSFGQSSKNLTDQNSFVLGSHLHSSNALDEGANPYWVVGGARKRTFFALEWCGGWEASLQGAGGVFKFNVRLPQADTQLFLQPNEYIDGPTLWVTPTAGLDEAQSRHQWMAERRALGQAIFGGPEPSFPLTYNTWYAATTDVNQKFVKKQIAQMTPYEFDAFIVDAGWYEKPGQWQASAAKFDSGQLEAMLLGLKEQGIYAGLWSTPQYTTPTGGVTTASIEQPGYFNDIAGGYLLDIAGNDFKSQLREHVDALRSQFSIDWWKYDQEFFVDDSRSGVMKNVIAFQKSLYSARRNNPTLMIENCLNGGRMINEFTALSSQTMWLRDGPKLGLEHAQQNVEIALEATEFLFPWLTYRFTKNFEALPPADDELTRFYCRSAMIGTWGISTDLRTVSEQQRAVILREARFYRYLTPIKLNYLYEIDHPEAGKAVAGVTFYNDDQQHAGVLLYRWQNQQAFTHRLIMQQLDPNRVYRVRDVDRRTRSMMSGAELMTTGVDVSFSAERLSALLFVDAVE